MIPRASVLLAVAFATVPPAGAQPLSPRNANYTIDVKLDTRARTLTAREKLVWTNITATATSELQFHLYYNAWRNRDSTWMREHTLTSWWHPAASRRSDDFAAIDVSTLELSAAHSRRSTSRRDALIDAGRRQ